MSGSLILVPALGAPFSLLICQVQTRWVLFYLIRFYFVRYGSYLLEALSKHFSMKKQKGEVNPERGVSEEELRRVKGGNNKQDSV